MIVFGVDMDLKLWKIRYYIRYWFRRKRERLFMRFMWSLPHSWMYMAVIRVWAHGTSGRWGTTAPDDLTWNEALKRWSTSNDIESSANE